MLFYSLASRLRRAAWEIGSVYCIAIDTIFMNIWVYFFIAPESSHEAFKQCLRLICLCLLETVCDVNWVDWPTLVSDEDSILRMATESDRQDRHILLRISFPISFLRTSQSFFSINLHNAFLEAFVCLAITMNEFVPGCLPLKHAR